LQKEDTIGYWIKSAEYDLASMESVFSSGRYDWALFIGHLAIEKILKALWAKKNFSDTVPMPPKTHNLAKLADESNFSCTENEKLLLLEISNFNIATRYPDYKFSFHKKCTKEFSEFYIIRIKELFGCILKQI
jgi:HEPN domain-containing protein